MFYNPNTKKF